MVTVFSPLFTGLDACLFSKFRSGDAPGLLSLFAGDAANVLADIGVMPNSTPTFWLTMASFKWR